MSDPLRILIVDDEELARKKINRFLTECKFDYITEEACNGLEALEKINIFKPDIVFLDIQMPGLSGFDVLYHLEQKLFSLIFQTAFDEFAIKAFEENACDYLLKPFSRERFHKALGRARERLGVEHYGGLETHLVKSSQYISKLMVKDRGDRTVLDVFSIDCITTKDHYCSIFAKNEEYLSDLSLAKLESLLDPQDFVRIHRNSLVNLHSIRGLSRSGDDMVILKNGMEISVSRRSRTNLIAMLDKLHLS